MPGRYHAPMAVSIVLEVNGSRRVVETDEGVTLLSVLRNALGLTGAKYGCGAGQCLSCAVLVDGIVVASCNVPATEFVGRPITTIEGVAGADALHPVQRAFIDESAAQCGFCTPGLVLASVALLRRGGRPTDGEVRSALADHLCRCGAHPAVLRAVRRVLDEELASE